MGEQGKAGHEGRTETDADAGATRLNRPSLRAPSSTGSIGDSTGSSATDSSGLPTRRVDPGINFIPVGAFGERYRKKRVLGKGGMGEVHLANDRRIGRMIALKVMRLEEHATDEARARFLREARIQGQLEHPAIVPVYDLDTDNDGRDYFTMKRIGGTTLAEALDRVQTGEAEALAEFTPRRLLTAFLQVCLALDYAHQRGVVHRDIKPSNVMLGRFGEVYLLDWGIAKLLDAEAPDAYETDAFVVTGDTDTSATRRGQVLGSPGYMSPEQAIAAEDIDARSDVYALGALLFQILTLEPLHGRGSAQERARSTQRGADARPSLLAPERSVAPEFDAICERATALEPKDRYANARELHDVVARVLEGDRDAELRRSLARRHVEQAVAALTTALASDAGAEAARRVALQEAGRALALDPDQPQAAEVLAQLMLAPPTTVPDEVTEEMEQLRRAEVFRGAFHAGWIIGLIDLVITGVVRTRLIDPSGLALISVPLLISAASGFYVAFAKPASFEPAILLLGAGACTGIGALSGLYGPSFFGPVCALAFAAGASGLHALGRLRGILVGMSCLAVLVPMLLQSAGVLSDPYSFEAGMLVITPRVMAFDGAIVHIALPLTAVCTIFLACVAIDRFTSSVAESRRSVLVQSWHLKQLTSQRPSPESASTTSSPATNDV